MKKMGLIRIAMGLTILLIVGFQTFWLRSSYLEARRLLQREVSIMLMGEAFDLYFGEDQQLFTPRETEDGTRAEVAIIGTPGVDSTGATPDSVSQLHFIQGMHLFMKHNFHHGSGRDSSGGPAFYEDPMVVSAVEPGELEARFRGSLEDEGIPLVPVLHLTNRPDTLAHHSEEFRTRGVPVDLTGGEVAYATFEGEFGALFPRILPQIALSFVLVGLTLLSFGLLYRNLKAHERLAQQQRQFISNISHELKTPIATVGVALEALGSFHGLDDPERTREYLDISRQELARLALLAERVLQLSLWESGEITIEPEPCDLRTLAAEVTDALRIRADQKGGVIELEVQEGDFGLRADRLHLTGVLYNLIDNALKYAAEAPHVRVTLSAKADKLRVEVQDNGIGIDTSDLKKIFDKFYRVQQGDRHNVKGYGLGLSYVAEIVRKHGGLIRAESQKGKGSTFVLEIPREPNG